MSIIETIRERHSVRRYTEKPLEGETLQALQAAVDEAAQQSGLNIQLVLDNPEVYPTVAKFGLIHGATASIAFVAKNDADEQIGYWGQRIVLTAQELGLNTCWVALCSRRKSKARRLPDEKIRLVIAVGYGEFPGKVRSTKPLEELCTIEGAAQTAQTVPAWFATAMEAAQLAPTAMNNQHFHITLRADGHTVALETPTDHLDLIDRGIVKRNFEEAANEAAAAQGTSWNWE